MREGRRALDATILAALAGALVAGCLRHEDPPPPPDPDACHTDADCAELDDGDPCFAPAACDAATTECYREFLQDDADCQCSYVGHCFSLGYERRGCNEVSCDRATHQCHEELLPAGPAPRPVRGDCTALSCDGASPDAIPAFDESDTEDDLNTCTVDACDMALGATHEPLADGATCLDGSGICYDVRCYEGCVPEDPEACGDEGPSEVVNDEPLGTDLIPGEHVCGMLDETDVDWFRKNLVDASFVRNVLRFSVRSTAPELELCAYVQCRNHASGGVPNGGCADKLRGPDPDSYGCCWRGPPATLAPSWDVDCTGTDDDAGALLFSVRGIGADACDTYALSVSY